MWILLVLLYGILKGGREIAKKKALEKNTVMEVLLVYTFLSFLMVTPEVVNAGGIEPKFYFYVAIKSLVIFIAWICSFKALKKLPVSLYGVLDLSRVLFSTLMGVVILQETLGILQTFGIILVSFGLLSLKFKLPFVKKIFKEDSDGNDENNSAQNKERISAKYLILALISCFFNSVSGLMDKILMKDISSSQLQFWYMLFLVIFYLIYILVKKEKITLSVFKNGWIWLLAIMFVIADKALFVANGMPESKVTVMTMLKQSSCLITILGGRLVFKEKNITYKLVCALIILTGIFLSVL